MQVSPTPKAEQVLHSCLVALIYLCCGVLYYLVFMFGKVEDLLLSCCPPDFAGKWCQPWEQGCGRLDATVKEKPRAPWPLGCGRFAIGSWS